MYDALNNAGSPDIGIKLEEVTDETIKAALTQQREARDEVAKDEVISILNENQAKIQTDVAALRELRRKEAEIAKKIKRHTDAQTLMVSPAEGEKPDFSPLLVILGHASPETLERCPPEFKKS